MGVSIEWARVSEAGYEFDLPGEIRDGYGNVNDELALCVGDGVVLEGSASAWIGFGEMVLRLARAARDAEVEAALAEVRERVAALESLVPGATYGGA